jgi:hypothetical protein
VFGQVNKFATGQFMLDTETGRLWQVNRDPDTGLFLLNVPYNGGSRVPPHDSLSIEEVN